MMKRKEPGRNVPLVFFGVTDVRRAVPILRVPQSQQRRVRLQAVFPKLMVPVIITRN
jgi:hypothetical protein